tara:strand:- start:535 stop:1215 length:681 start_codon:yes stop_codon:yes gene_type:complete
MSFLGIIPARKGSKSLLNKNILKINNKPLFFYAANALINSNKIDKKIYSTDSKIISNYATKYGFEKRSLRPKKLSTDKTKIIDVLKYELVKESKYNNFKYVVLVQATSPTVTTNLIDRAIVKALKEDADNVITGFDCNMKHPSTFFSAGANNKIEWLVNDKNRDSRRQDFRKYFIRTGLVYVIKSKLILNNKLYGKKIHFIQIPEEHAITIDTLSDFKKAKNLLKK